jgi:archaellum component FlaF (FlaF/FlaG flagellin family)
MALEKKIVVDKIEVLTNGCVQVRTSINVVEDGVTISSSYKRHIVVPGQDYSQEDQRVQDICAVAHTPEVVSAYNAA